MNMGLIFGGVRDTFAADGLAPEGQALRPLLWTLKLRGRAHPATPGSETSSAVRQSADHQICPTSCRPNPLQEITI